MHHCDYKRVFLIIISTIICFLVFSQHNIVFAEERMGHLSSELADYLTEHEAKMAGTSVILIKDDDMIVQNKGYANIEEEKAVDEETVFEWGSVSKLLIWISIFQLMEEGLVDLETDIMTYLPEDFQVPLTYNQSITLAHLMNHTAGFEDSYTDLMLHNPKHIKSLKDALESTTIKQVFPPGEIVAYSNYGAALAAYIVEEVSGLDYREYVQVHIFAQVGMEKTAIDPEYKDNLWVKEQRNLIEGYTEDLQLIEPNDFVIPLYPAGSVIGVSTDLARLVDVLLTDDGTPLFTKEETIEHLFETSLYYPNSTIPRIANGLFYLPAPAESGFVFGHGGNTIAFTSSVYVNREEKLGTIVMTNLANDITFTLGIPELVFGKYKPEKADSVVEDVEQWRGVYELARAPHHGFSQFYKLFLRTKVNVSDDHKLNVNNHIYRQIEDGVYVDEDAFSAYAIDVYYEHEEMGKVLSSGVSDLLYLPLYKHVMEWALLILGLSSGLFSVGFVMVSLIKKIRRKNMLILPFIQHVLHSMFLLNILFIVYKAFSMTSYELVKPFLTANIIYLIISFIISIILLIQWKKYKVGKRFSFIMALFVTVILSSNLLYWEFYY